MGQPDEYGEAGERLSTPDTQSAVTRQVDCSPFFAVQLQYRDLPATSISPTDIAKGN